MQEGRVYKAGDCPTCPGFGAVLFVRAAVSGRLFFLCPHCGVAWPEPPSPEELDTVELPERYAPEGVDLPTRSEIEQAGRGGLIASELAYDDWAESLSVFLKE